MEEKSYTRKRDLLKIVALEKTTDAGETFEVRDGYEYIIDGAIPEIADSIAKMAVEMNADKEIGENAGQMFLSLIAEFYNMLVGADE